ncbi:MAG: hypothetical protein AAGD43_04610 [Pseudomonadota bacterium]
MHKPNIVVLGYSGLIGRQLIPQLIAAGFTGQVVSRSRRELPGAFEWIDSLNFIDGTFSIPVESVVLSLCKLPLTAEFSSKFAQANQLIALSSTSVFTKQSSSDPGELRLSQRLQTAEELIQATSEDLPYTILRPTIIYDAETDVSINQIAKIIRRYGFFAVAGRGSGLRQPIHAADVAAMMVQCIERDAVKNVALNISGGEPLSYRKMVERIAVGIGTKPRIVSVPVWLLKGLVSVMRILTLTKHSPNMIDRMNNDMAFDNSKAVALLEIQPRKFHPDFTHSEQ